MSHPSKPLIHLLKRHLAKAFLALLTICLVPVQAATSPPEFKLEKTPAWVNTVAFDPQVSLGPDQQRGGVSYLLADRQVQLKGASRESYNHFALKIQSESGLERSANVEIEFDPSYQKLLIHAVDVRRRERVISKLTQGAVKILQREKSLEQMVFDGSKTANLFLEDVRVGDVIDYAYTLVGSNPVFAGHQSGQFDFQWGTPVQLAYARLLVDAAHPVSLKLLRSDAQAQRRDIGNMHEWVWRLSALPAIRFRDDVPKWFDPQPGVQWTDFSDWNAVVRWALPLYTLPSDLPPELLQEVQRIKLMRSDAADRAVEALRYVQKTIRYLGVEVGPGTHAPNAPAEVLARRYGDCKDKTVLTLTMLKALGIEAYPALVNTKTERGVLNEQASPCAFNHVLVLAVIDNEVFWLDPTMPPQMGSVRDISQGNFGYALVLKPGESALTEMKTALSSTYYRKVVAVYDTRSGWEKPVQLTVTTTLDGRSAERMRARVGQEPSDSLQKQMANYFAKTYSGLVVDRPFSLYDNTETNQMVVTEYYVIADFWKKLDNDRVQGYFAAPDVLDYLRNPSNALRDEPLALAHCTDVSQTTFIQTPEKWKLKGGTTTVQDPSFHFVSNAAVSTGLVTEVDRYRSLKDAVEAKDMPAYLVNLRKARDALGYTITRSTQEEQ